MRKSLEVLSFSANRCVCVCCVYCSYQSFKTSQAIVYLCDEFTKGHWMSRGLTSNVAGYHSGRRLLLEFLMKLDLDASYTAEKKYLLIHYFLFKSSKF